MPAVVYKDSIISIISVVNAISLQFLRLGRYVCRHKYIHQEGNRETKTDQNKQETHNEEDISIVTWYIHKSSSLIWSSTLHF